MAERSVAITKRDLTLTIYDAGAAHSYSPTVFVGDFKYEAPLHDTTRIRNAGALYGIRKGDDQPVKVSGTSVLTDVGDSTEYTMADLCEDRGAVASGWTSTTANLSDISTYDLVATVDGAVAGVADKTMTFDDLEFKSGGASFGDPAQYPWSGESATSNKPTVA
jgi:hypothetical protein